MGEIFYRLKGEIDYSEAINSSIPTTVELNNEITLDLTISASLENLGGKDFIASTGGSDSNVLYINSKTENIIQETADAHDYTLEKTFPVVKGQDELDLNCTFLVTTDGIKLEQAVLVNPRIDSIKSIN